MSDRSIERIEKALSTLGSELVPPSGWEERVLARVAPPPWWRRRWVLAAPLLAACAAIIVLVLRLRSPAPLHLAWVPGHGTAQMRGHSLRAGTTGQATVRGGRHRALWIYRNGTELVMACPGDAACRVTDDGITATVRLDQVGSYVLLAVSADEPFDPPSGNYDKDAAAASAKPGFNKEEVPLDVQ